MKNKFVYVKPSIEFENFQFEDAILNSGEPIPVPTVPLSTERENSYGNVWELDDD